MKYKIGDTVYLDDPWCLSHGKSGTITRIDTNHIYPYLVDFGATHVYHPEQELLTSPPKTKCKPWKIRHD